MKASSLVQKLVGGSARGSPPTRASRPCTAINEIWSAWNSMNVRPPWSLTSDRSTSSLVNDRWTSNRNDRWTWNQTSAHSTWTRNDRWTSNRNDRWTWNQTSAHSTWTRNDRWTWNRCLKI